MSRITYYPRIPTSRKLVPSKYQRMRRQRTIVLNVSITFREFMDAMQRAADSMGQLMERLGSE